MATTKNCPKNLMFSNWHEENKNTPSVLPAGSKGIRFGSHGLETKTAGDGYWSREQRTVHIVRLVIDKLWYSQGFRAELQANFNKKDWDVDKHGLIYTDKLWIEQFKKHLLNMGFSAAAVRAVDYSEQGMQGDNYVSMDIGDAFIREFAVLFCFGNTIDKHGLII